ncbi:hypothetical protein [uncultured Chryseobacterium sp.]|uniref:hypothetical protein n=1 Tax=uncultured Chryseobacterium sp. TaxID=259322 RepID=UPI00258784EF|nr:hypothetical protein [uncultured Chryseobacterium sp.]
MLAKYQEFSNIFHINTYGFTSALRTKLFYLYLYQYEDQYTVSKLLAYFGTKPDILNNAVDMFTENASLSWDDFYNQFLATPCEKIKAQRGNADFYAKMNVLESNTGLKMETGYIQRNNNNYEYKDNATATETSNSLGLPNASLTENKDIKGYMHTHVDDFTYTNADGDEVTRKGIKIFSPADVSYFMDMVKNAKDTNKPLGEIYAVMVSGSVNYQIRFTGNQYQVNTFTDSQVEALKNPYIKFMESRIGKQKQLELGFLQFINDKMNLKGVSLYRMNADGTNTEINLNADKTDTTETNC